MAEETTLRLQQVICPSCKRPINTFNPNNLMAKCPYCNSKLVNPLVKPKAMAFPDRIIQFKTREEDFEKVMVTALVNQNYVPTDIFDIITADKVIQVYLPMFLFEGTYNASWACEYAEQGQRVDVSRNWQGDKTLKTKNVTNWRPQNGNAAGNFALLCLAHEGNDVPEELRNFTRLFPYDVMMSKEFEPNLIDANDNNLMVVERNSDAQLVWQKYGKQMVEDTARNAAYNQLGGQQIRNFRATTSHNITNMGKLVLVPFWFVYYKYNNKQYHFLMDGIGVRTSYDYPVNEEEVQFVKGKKNIINVVKWLWLLAIVFLLIAGLVGGLIYAGVWLVGYLITQSVMNSQINQRLAESKAARQAGAEKL